MGSSKLTIFIISISIISLVTVFFIIIYFQIKVAASKNGTALVTSQAIFYVPSNNPTKVYTFPAKPQELIDQIEALTKNTKTTYGIYIKNLTTNQEVAINANESFTSASLYKLGVMYAIYQKAAEGKVSLINNDVKQNLKSMITVSSNEAALSLVDSYTSWNEVTQIMHSIGLNNTDFRKDPLVTTPRDMGTLLELLAEGEAVSKDASLSMLILMNEQKINDRIPVLLPDGVVIAHKTGELDDVRHDVGILGDENNDYILVLMSKGTTYPETVKPVMAKISQIVYEYFKNQWAVKSAEIL